MRKIVVKVGTSTLTQGTQKLSKKGMLDLVQQIVHLRSKGLEIILVSSGAVAAGRELLREMPLILKQSLACVGQVKLMQVWYELFSLFDFQVGQLLLTKEDFFGNKKKATQEVLIHLLQDGILPIVNENDAVAIKQWSVGNNDSLAAMVAKIVGADHLILLTDQEGLYSADPRVDPKATLISFVEQVDEGIRALAGGSSTSLGTGGMATKIEAAHMASEEGIRTIIACAFRPQVLVELVEGKPWGTVFSRSKK